MVRLLGKVFEGHKAVIRFFGQAQHVRCEGGLRERRQP